MNENERRIAELIKAENGNITAKEIAARLFVSTTTVHQTVRRYGLKIIKRRRETYEKKYLPCQDRPQGCFNCPYDDCICNTKASTDETRFISDILGDKYVLFQLS